jgi:integrase/recombinase XerD
MSAICWEHYPALAQVPTARAWLTIQSNLGLAPNTVTAYGRALDDYLTFCTHQLIPPDRATHEHIARYVRDLTERPNPRAVKRRSHPMDVGLANATLQQRLTVVRLYYDYLVEVHLCAESPIGRGYYTPGKGFGGARDRGLIPRYRTLPWIPNDDQWHAILLACRAEPIRNRVMLALAYDAGLRREELCALDVNDLNPGQRTVRIRPETTKNWQERIVPYSEATSVLYARYVDYRRQLTRDRGPLFLSESRRNRAQPLTIWTWSKVVQRIATGAQVPHFTPHTLRHLCLTDLARAGWDLHEIATFAGHRSTQTTLVYIHLSGRDLAAKLARGMNQIHAWRTAMLTEVLG